MPNALVFKISNKLATSNITLKPFNTREVLFEKILLQNIDNHKTNGMSELIINKKVFKLKLRERIITQAYAKAYASFDFNTNEQLKMISAAIKSVYEN